MALTYEPIASTTLSSAASAITFSGIPATFTDIRLVVVGVTSATAINVNFRVNSDTGTNFSLTQLAGSTAATGSVRNSNQTSLIGYWQAGTDANPSTYIVDLLSYANTSINKTILYSGGSMSEIFRGVGLWRSTAAITSVSLFPASGNWNSGATGSLYGIKAA